MARSTQKVSGTKEEKRRPVDCEFAPKDLQPTLKIFVADGLWKQRVVAKPSMVIGYADAELNDPQQVGVRHLDDTHVLPPHACFRGGAGGALARIAVDLGRETGEESLQCKDVLGADGTGQEGLRGGIVVQGGFPCSPELCEVRVAPGVVGCAVTVTLAAPALPKVEAALEHRPPRHVRGITLHAACRSHSRDYVLAARVNGSVISCHIHYESMRYKAEFRLCFATSGGSRSRA
jgi:hypothetical protein